MTEQPEDPHGPPDAGNPDTADEPDAAFDDVGDTEVFGPWIGDLLADWDEARALVRSFADESCWHKVRELAVECEADPWLYLQFVGD